MAKINVIIELAPSANLGFMMEGDTGMAPFTYDSQSLPKIGGVKYDTDFPPTSIPGRTTRNVADSVLDVAPYDLAFNSNSVTYIVRAEIEDKKIDDIKKDQRIIGVFSDPIIEPVITCGSSPVGNDADVERLLCTARMRACGMDGNGVIVAIVDTGINIAHLNSKGKTPSFDPANSWVPRAGLTPGSLPVGHGTMCAFDVCIAAPKCTLLDIALLQSSGGLRNVLSDAVRAYRHLIGVMMSPLPGGQRPSMVVNNSWGMFNPSQDFPVGHPGNYSHNPNHPFNRIVGDLERAGADIIFAAGNCGPDCPDSRCQGVTTNCIYGANSHPSVLSVAGVDIHKARVGYSSKGPGCLTANKPDISGYTHFNGSGVYPADGGTSAACPVVAGVVAAVRTKRPYDPTNPAATPAGIRSFITSNAEDVSPSGYDLDTGFGIVSGCNILTHMSCVSLPPDICTRYPWLCRPYPTPTIDICRRYPWLCQPFPMPPIPTPVNPPIPPRSPFGHDWAREYGYGMKEGGNWLDPSTDAEGGMDYYIYMMGYQAALQQYEAEKYSHSKKRGDCGCGCK